jgi:hypothetical protein
MNELKAHAKRLVSPYNERYFKSNFGLPLNHLLIPYKKRPGQGLTTDEAKVNQIISSKRVRIEQVNRYFKNFGVMSGTWRGTEEQNGDIFKVLAKITNIYLQESPMYPE